MQLNLDPLYSAPHCPLEGTRLAPTNMKAENYLQFKYQVCVKAPGFCVMCSVRASSVKWLHSGLCKNPYYCINTVISQSQDGAQTEQRGDLLCADKRPLFWVTHHPVQKQSPDSLVKKLINSLTLFCSSTGKLKCQRCCEQQREYMMSDKTERSERENRDLFIQPTMQGFQTRNLDIINNTYSLSSAAACRGVKVQEGEAWYCWHRHRNHSDILTSSLGSSLKWRKLFSLNGLERAGCREC